MQRSLPIYLWEYYAAKVGEGSQGVLVAKSKASEAYRKEASDRVDEAEASLKQWRIDRELSPGESYEKWIKGISAGYKQRTINATNANESDDERTAREEFLAQFNANAAKDFEALKSLTTDELTAISAEKSALKVPVKTWFKNEFLILIPAYNGTEVRVLMYQYKDEKGLRNAPIRTFFGFSRDESSEYLGDVSEYTGLENLVKRRTGDDEVTQGYIIEGISYALAAASVASVGVGGFAAAGGGGGVRAIAAFGAKEITFEITSNITGIPVDLDPTFLLKRAGRDASLSLDASKLNNRLWKQKELPKAQGASGKPSSTTKASIPDEAGSAKPTKSQPPDSDGPIGNQKEKRVDNSTEKPKDVEAEVKVAPDSTVFTNRLKYRFVGDAAQQQKLLDDLADLKKQYGALDHFDEVGKAQGRITFGTFDPATAKIKIYRGGDDLTELEELLHWKFHKERLDRLGWSQADFLKRWDDPSDTARQAFRRQYYDTAEAEIVRILRDEFGWVK